MEHPASETRLSSIPFDALTTEWLYLALRNNACDRWSQTQRRRGLYPRDMSLETGTEAEGTVFKILNIGALVRFEGGDVGLVHISEIAHEYVRQVEDYLREEDEVKVKVLGVNDQGRFELSLKALTPAPANPTPERGGGGGGGGGRSGGGGGGGGRSGGDLEDKLADFQKRSQQRMSAVRKRQGRRTGRR